MWLQHGPTLSCVLPPVNSNWLYGTSAGILWHLLKFQQPFHPEVFAHAEAKLKQQKFQRLKNMAASLNYQLVPQPGIPLT